MALARAAERRLGAFGPQAFANTAWAFAAPESFSDEGSRVFLRLSGSSMTFANMPKKLQQCMVGSHRIAHFSWIIRETRPETLCVVTANLSPPWGGFAGEALWVVFPQVEPESSVKGFPWQVGRDPVISAPVWSVCRGTLSHPLPGGVPAPVGQGAGAEG